MTTPPLHSRSTSDGVASTYRMHPVNRAVTNWQRLSTSVKACDGYPQAPQRKHDKITDTQLPSSCVFADSRSLLDRATQMDCGMKFLNLWAQRCASLHGQHRCAGPVSNFLFNEETALKYVQQIAAQRTVLG